MVKFVGYLMVTLVSFPELSFKFRSVSLQVNVGRLEVSRDERRQFYSDKIFPVAEKKGLGQSIYRNLDFIIDFPNIHYKCTFRVSFLHPVSLNLAFSGLLLIAEA